ncbi:MAG: DEAD/DEAH box helicase [Cyanobacteria bacterium J06634_6]
MDSDIVSAADRVLSPAQQFILSSGLLTIGFNCILQMPTGSGKTWLAEQAIEDILSRNKRAIYLTPLRALASELTGRWQQRFQPRAVGIFTGDYATRAYPVPYQQAQLLVMTPEKLDACTRSWRSHWHWLPEVDLVVVDEVHLLGDPHRGPRLEGALLRLMRLNPFVKILGLSATLGNRHELADWLGGVEYASTWRPVPLSWEVARYRQAQDKPALLVQAAHRNIEAGGQTLVFVQSRRRAESLAKVLQASGLLAAHHHAGLEHADRRQTESAFRSGEIAVLVATATLEMGLNLPVRQVILYDLQGFDGVDFVPLSVNSVWQRAGRAGRPGLDPTGEVVLIAPQWDRHGDGYVDQYSEGRFEPIYSGLSRAIALSEQVIAEVASGLCRTIGQLESVFAQSLAAKQRSLASISDIVAEMLQADMLKEVDYEGKTRLRATQLGYIATRHMISPQTVLLFKRILEQSPDLTFLDLLILAASSEDCQPLIPVDFEVLEELGQALSHEPSRLLNLPHLELSTLLGHDGKRLLAILQTALIGRAWTRLGDSSQVADSQGCYAFEVACLRESMERLLTAMGAIAAHLAPDVDIPLTDWVPLDEKVRRLTHMVSTGLDEQTVTLTLVKGIGVKMARQLRLSGLADIEDLALADPSELVSLPGIGHKRASQWVKEAEDMVDCHSSAYRYEESAPSDRMQAHLQGRGWPDGIEPYRLRRAMALKVQGQDGGVYRITGGLDPHRVRMRQGQFGCDCQDFAKGHLCKHVLAVRLFRRDTQLKELSATISEQTSTAELDLFRLWMGA